AVASSIAAGCPMSLWFTAWTMRFPPGFGSTAPGSLLPRLVFVPALEAPVMSKKMSLEQFRMQAAFGLCAMSAVLALATVAIEVMRWGGLGVASLLAVGTLAALLGGVGSFRHQPAFRYLAVSVLMGQVIASL